MAEKNLWKLVLQLASPLQVGAGSLGMVEKTEMFIPGRLAWAVLTAALTRKFNRRPRKPDYDLVGDHLGQWPDNFSSFFPSFDNGDSCWLPVYDGNQRSWFKKNAAGFTGARVSEAAMEAVLLGGLAGHATDPLTMASDSGSLHETDLIAPLVPDIDDRRRLVKLCYVGFLRLPAALTGLRGLQSPCRLDQELLTGVFAAARFGGGRKRGWGAVRVSACEVVEGDFSAADISCCGFDSGRILLLSPVFPVAETQQSVQGRARLETYREHSAEKGSGGDFTTARLCWQVGSLVAEQEFRESFALSG